MLARTHEIRQHKMNAATGRALDTSEAIYYSPTVFIEHTARAGVIARAKRAAGRAEGSIARTDAQGIRVFDLLNNVFVRDNHGGYYQPQTRR
jgi:hypothetical protein